MLLIQIFTSIFLVPLLLPLVSSDIFISDLRNNSLLFQTSSHLFRSSKCGSFHTPSLLVTSEPVGACEVPKRPPSYSIFTHLLFALLDDYRIDAKWILLIRGDVDVRKCSLKQRMRNAAAAGYSGVILGTYKSYKELVNSGLLEPNKGEGGFIDVHVVNPFDIKILSKTYAYPKEFLLAPPEHLTKCKDFIEESRISRTFWWWIMSLWQSISDCPYMIFDLVRGMMPKPPAIFSIFLEPGTYARLSLTEVFFFTYGSLFLVLIFISYLNYDPPLFKTKNEDNKDNTKQEKQGSYTTNNENSRTYFTFNDENYQRQYHFPSPPPPPPNPLLKHLSNLEIEDPFLGRLTEDMILSAYRKVILKYHPDKFSQENEAKQQEMTRKAQVINSSRDTLLNSLRQA